MDFVLLPGAWMDARIWELVARGMREFGHGVRPVTQSGLADADVEQATYVACAFEVPDDVAALCEGANWILRTLDTGHWPMVSAPDQLVALLAEAASEQKE